MASPVRLLAYYLPQFHPIPENDRWWGSGFTEWTGVRRASAMYRDHNQPHFPGELGYYDLRDSKIQIRQAELARKYGIYGFCYYYYWFSGKRLLETPLEAMRLNPEVDLPYCLCWANENWTRRWDGQEQEVLMAQTYSPEDDLAFASSLIPHFRDERYVRVDGKPLLMVYRTNLFPDIAASAERWRSVWQAAGIGEVYLVRAETVGQRVDPRTIGFDAASEFPPHPYDGEDLWIEGRRAEFKGHAKDYVAMMNRFRARKRPDYTLLRGVCPSWDQTPRRMLNGLSYFGSSPQEYRKWLSFAVRDTLENVEGDERLIFVNAWNEWGEGAHLEPCRRFQYQHLEVTSEALREPYHDGWEFEQLAARPLIFSINAWPLDEGGWVETTYAFLRGLPSELEARLYLRVEADNDEVYQAVRQRLAPLWEGLGGRARSKVYLHVEGTSYDLDEAVVEFPKGYRLDERELQSWWVESVSRLLAEESAGAADRYKQHAEKGLASRI